MTSTVVPTLNISLSCEIDGGFVSDMTVFAGPSKHAKSIFALVMAKAYLDKYPDSVLLFYDCEFGTPEGYFISIGIDMDRVIHIPFGNIEELKIDMVKQFVGLTRGDKVITVIDSLGNAPSKKELEDAIDGKNVADMSRAKQINSLLRMITPYFSIKNIHCVVVAKTYKEQSLFPKDIVAGGQGIMFAADNLFILGKQQEKDGSELTGYNFIINVEKSRFCREKSKIPIQLKFEEGFSKYSGLLDIALDIGRVVKPSNGYYSRVDSEGIIEDKKWRSKASETSEFWNVLLNDDTFKEAIGKRYKISNGNMFTQDDNLDLNDLETI
jgi:hypothetical protein